MIAFIKGRLAGKTQDSAFVEAGGIGYAIFLSTTNISNLPEVGEEVVIHTYLQVRDDAFVLFGFNSLEEKALFLRLISVSGVGPKMALSALSLYNPQTLITHITSQDITAISRIPGVGKKTASRIVLELKGSFDQELLAKDKGDLSSNVVRAAREALFSMGFSDDEAELALKGAPDSSNEAGLLQYALKRLGQ